MIKSNKEVTPEPRETYFLYRKPQKLKFAKKCFSKIIQEKNEKFLLLGKLHSAVKTKTQLFYRVWLYLSLKVI